MGATDRELHALPYYGCLVVDLYNAVRPHQSLNYFTPTEFKQHHQSQSLLQSRAISQE